jgi:hypothetical protein
VASKRSSNNSVRRLLWGGLFVALGAGLWWIAARTARFSVKQWDATMETAVKHALTSVGVADTDVLSSVHEIRRDKKGEWVVQRMSVAVKDRAALPVMARELESSGAQVQQTTLDGEPLLIVKHGERVYQEIQVHVR